MNSATNTVVDSATEIVTETATEIVAESTTEIVAIQQQLELINVADKLTLKLLADKINEIITVMNSAKSSNTVTRDRGPKSEKVMTESDARLILLGEMKNVSHMECAEKLHLSYGQIYSARKGFTFKTVYKEYRDSLAK